MCINMGVKYHYQIKNVLQNEGRGITGFRVLVIVDALDFITIDVPAEIFEFDVLQYLKVRLKIHPKIEIQKLPLSVQYKIRVPLGRFLDLWVLEEKDGYHIKRKDTDA